MGVPLCGISSIFVRRTAGVFCLFILINDKMVVASTSSDEQNIISKTEEEETWSTPVRAKNKLLFILKNKKKKKQIARIWWMSSICFLSFIYRNQMSRCIRTYITLIEIVPLLVCGLCS